jgi:hypothetical protein
LRSAFCAPPPFSLSRRPQELISVGSRNVVITDLLNGTQYAPRRFERLVADKKRA